jgi:hypothetical protein
VRDPVILMTVLATVLAGIAAIKITSLTVAQSIVQSLQAQRRLGTRLIETFDALGLAAFIVVGVVAVLDTSAEPLWLWGPISAGITSSFGSLMGPLSAWPGNPQPQRRALPGNRGCLGAGTLAVSRVGGRAVAAGRNLVRVVITIIGAFLTRMAAVVYDLRGWACA